jgi:hypothetical protein
MVNRPAVADEPPIQRSLFASAFIIIFRQRQIYSIKSDMTRRSGIIFSDREGREGSPQGRSPSPSAGGMGIGRKTKRLAANYGATKLGVPLVWYL